jgi:2-iminobutanoate/2-iminopropanoate deaminase
MKKKIHTEAAPEAIGPYSQAVKVSASEMLFCSGQIPIDPVSGKMVDGSAAEQTKRVMENLAAILDASGFTLEDVVKTTIYLVDLSFFAEVNEVYRTYFSETFPARATVQVAALPRNAAVEIELIACK